MRVGLARLISLLFVLIGLFSVTRLFAERRARSSGFDTTGRVTHVTRARGRSGRDFTVSFTFTDSDDNIRDDHAFMQWVPVVGQDIPVRASSFGPFHFAVLQERTASASGFLYPAAFMCVWCGLALLFAMIAWSTAGIERDQTTVRHSAPLFSKERARSVFAK